MLIFNKLGWVSDLERMRLEYLQSQTGNVMVRKEPVDKTRDTVPIFSSVAWQRYQPSSAISVL